MWVHNQIYTTACQMAQLVDVEESRPRQASRQQQHPNVRTENCSDYFRQFPFLTI